VDLHFGELAPPARERVMRHLDGCPACRAQAEDLARVERALVEAPDELAPSDGLARVMAEVDAIPRGPAPTAAWTPALGATLVGVAGAASLIAAAASWLLESPVLLGTPLPSLGPLSSLGLAAAAFFTLGSFATLALAPVLLLEPGLKAARAGR
jgi:anti-sigma factor RsiW